MKNTRAFAMIGVSCAVALVAVVLASKWISQQANLSTKKVAVAAADINLGTRLSPEMVVLTEWPAESVPTGSFTDPKAVDTRVTRVALQRGEPLTETKLALPGATGGLSAVVAEGKRAMTVRVNDVIGVAGFALPGNFVDILVSTQGENIKGENRDLNISKLVLERILVLAVAQEANQNDTKPKVVNAVTLEVTPEQAEKLDLARSVGQLSLVLRNQIDMKPAETAGATKETLLALKQAKEGTDGKAADAQPKMKATKPKSAKQCHHVITGSGTITQCY